MDIETSVKEPFARASSTNSSSSQKGSFTPSAAPNAEAIPPSTELHHFLSDIEHLIREATSLTGEELNQVKVKIRASMATARKALDKMGNELADTARKSATSTNDYVHHQPWAAIGTGAAAGLLVGFLLSRRKH